MLYEIVAIDLIIITEGEERLIIFLFMCLLICLLEVID